MRNNSAPTSRRTVKQKAFTLIELLVVIAIIALLVSILIPSLTKAKSMAKQVVCQTNLHDLYMAHSFYAEENNDWQVPTMAPALTTGNAYDKNAPLRWNWYLTYHEFLPWGSGKYGYYDGYYSLATICPTHGEFDRNCYYARNYYNYCASFQLEVITNPADKVMIADSYDDWETGTHYWYFDSEPYWYWEGQSPGDPSLHGRHVNGQACIVYMDGHNGALSEEDKEHGLLELNSWRIPKGRNGNGGPREDSQLLIDLGL
jgi:prepilin-type N-terminal cleavage/methylation domain-containing protein